MPKYIIFAVFLLSTCLSYGTLTENHKLKPVSKPNASWSIPLNPNQDARYTVDMIQEERGYVFESGGIKSETNNTPEFLWVVTDASAPSGYARRYVGSAVNAGWYEGTASFTVTCRWVRVRSTGGSGAGGGGVDEIFGAATGHARALPADLQLEAVPDIVCTGSPPFVVSARLVITGSNRTVVCEWSLDPAAHGTVTPGISDTVTVTPTDFGLLTVKAVTQRGLPPTPKSIDVPVVKVRITDFYRVVPRAGNEKSVVVTTTPCPLPAGVSVDLSIFRTSGIGDARIIDPASASITRTTEIRIRGIEQSWGIGDTPARNNMELRATLPGSTIPCDTKNFTICAHVDNVSNQFTGNVGENAIQVSVTWQSDSGSGQLPDLDKCLIREHVSYPSSPVPAPFQAWHPPNPTREPPGGAIATGGSAVDIHRYNPGLAAIAANPVEGSFNANQWYQYGCRRCGTEWVNLENYTIKRETLAPTAAEPRRYRVTKTGAGLGAEATRTVNLP